MICSLSNQKSQFEKTALMLQFASEHRIRFDVGRVMAHKQNGTI